MGKQFEDDEDDMDMYVTIEFDDGSEVDYKVIGIFEIEGQDYVAVSDDYEEASDSSVTKQMIIKNLQSNFYHSHSGDFSIVKNISLF